MNPPDTSEFLTAFNAGRPLAEMVPAGGYRFGEAFNHAVSAEDHEDGKPKHPIPCYTCGTRVSLQVCRECCRNLCNVCLARGGHQDRRCDFVISGRMPDGPEQSQHA